MKDRAAKVIKMVRARVYRNRVNTAVNAPELVQEDMVAVVARLDEATEALEKFGDGGVVLNEQLRLARVWIDKAVEVLREYAAGDTDRPIEAADFLTDHPTVESAPGERAPE